MMLPDELLQRLLMFAEANNIALAHLISEKAGIGVILMGKQGMSPDQASILAAHMLLTGVVTGGISDENTRSKEEEKSVKPN